MPDVSHCSILLAAGSGTRMNGVVDDKALVLIKGLPVICYSVLRLVEAKLCDHLVLVYRDTEQRSALEDAIAGLKLTSISIIWVQGGKERYNSVHQALEAVPTGTDYVYIHDSARPLVSTRALTALREQVMSDGAAVLAHPVTDTIKRTTSAVPEGPVELEDLERNRLWAMETPQGFQFKTILECYRHVVAQELTITDDTAAAATCGVPVCLVHNPDPNPKITTPADLDYANWLADQSSAKPS